MGGNAIEVLAGEHDEIQDLFRRVSSPDEDRPAVLKDLMQYLSGHVAVEKQMLMPVLKERVPGGAELADTLSDEHDRVEKILTLLERRKVNSPDVVGLVNELLDLSDRHIDEADASVFPAMRASLSGPELDELGAAITSDERSQLTHPHPALPDSGPVAGVTRKLAQVVDGVRDRSSDVNRTSS